MKELLHAFQPLIFCKGTNCMFGSKIDQIICKESFLSRLKTLELDVWWPRIFDEGSVEQRVILENDNICIRFKWQFCDLAHSLLQKTYHQYCCAQSYEGCWNIYAGAIAVRSTFAFIIVFDRVPYLRGGQKLTFFSYAQNVVSGYHYVCGLLQMISFLGTIQWSCFDKKCWHHFLDKCHRCSLSTQLSPLTNWFYPSVRKRRYCCFTVSLFHCFTVSLFLLITCSIVFYFMDHSVTVFPSCTWAIFCALAHYSARTYYSSPLFACPIIFHYRLILFAPACSVVWSKVSTILWFSLFFRKASNVSQTTRKRQQRILFCKIVSQVKLSWQDSWLKRQILWNCDQFQCNIVLY